MIKDEALKLALEALEADELDMVDDGSGNMVFRKDQAITAIKEALAQPEQHQDWCASLTQLLMSMPPKPAPCNCNTPQRKETEQETVEIDLPKPIGYVSEGSVERLATNKQAHEQIRSFRLFTHDVPLYTTPQRTWFGLTDEEISNLWSWSMTREAELTATTQQHAFAQAIEAKLKEKNT